MRVGEQLPGREFRVTRADLVRYAGAGGDFNPIHWSTRAARSAGLPDAIAHGMLTMALVGRYVTDWARGAELRSFEARFTAPVVVPDDGNGAVVTVFATVSATDPDLVLGLRATCDGVVVLSDGRAVLRRAD